jgi:hypothetical protein
MSWHLPEGAEGNHKNLIQNSQLLDQDLILSNTSVDYYCYSNAFDCAIFKRMDE